MRRQTLAIVSLFIVLTGGEVGLFLWLYQVEIAGNRAEAFVRQGAHASAVEQYQVALRRKPDRPELYLSLSRAMASAWRLAEAREAVSRALALNPRYGEAQQFSLELAQRTGDNPGVISAAQAVLATQQGNPSARRALARALVAVGRKNEAEAEYRGLIARGPTDAFLFAELAALLQAKGDVPAAEEAIRKAIKITPREDRFRLTLADLLLGRGHFAEAAELYEQHLAQAPSDHAVRLRLAETLMGMRALDRAATAYRSVLEQSPSDVEVRIKLARVLSWLRRYEESIAEYRRALGDS